MRRASRANERDSCLMAKFAPKVADWYPVRETETSDGYFRRMIADGFNESQRAMAVVLLHEASKELRADHQTSKMRWVSAARLAFVPPPRSPCAVCGLYEALTHAHHCLPLTLQFDLGVQKAVHDHDWLCPTHHAALHIIIDGLLANKQAQLSGVPYDEQDALQSLAVKFVALWKPHYFRAIGIAA